jgi:hypothetical protein
MSENSGQFELYAIIKRGPDFDFRTFALQGLERAKENLRNDGFLTPVAFLVTGEDIRCYGIWFQGWQQKDAVYSSLIDVARSLNARAIITINDCYAKTPAPEDVSGHFANYKWGDLVADHDYEEITMTVTGPDIPTWIVHVPYGREGKELNFGELHEQNGGDVGLLEGWPKSSSTTQ